MSKYIKEEEACVRLWKKLRGLSDVIPMGKDAAGVAVRIIEDLPIADVEPVRHGKWMEAADDGVWRYTDAYAECDQCHKVTFNGWNMSFCPNCGTRMDGEERKPFMINKECYLEPTVDKNGIPCMAIRKVKGAENE